MRRHNYPNDKERKKVERRSDIGPWKCRGGAQKLSTSAGWYFRVYARLGCWVQRVCIACLQTVGKNVFGT